MKKVIGKTILFTLFGMFYAFFLFCLVVSLLDNEMNFAVLHIIPSNICAITTLLAAVLFKGHRDGKMLFVTGMILFGVILMHIVFLGQLFYVF